MKVTQISIGRFHHFHLARQMEKHGLLDSIWTGYPKFKLKDEQGIPSEKIKSYPWVQAAYMKRGKLGLAGWDWLSKEWAWLAQQTIDKHVAKNLNNPTILIALSASGLHAGAAAKTAGGYHICDRGSSHIRYQDRLLREEYQRWGLSFKGIDPRIIAKEEAEYEQADLITVPSEFARRSFIDLGITAKKVIKIPYGSRVDRFKKIAEPAIGEFHVLFVGGITIQKGFLYLLEAFRLLRHPLKKLTVIGEISHEMKKIISARNIDKVDFKGVLPNVSLPFYYSSAHAFVLPSIQEGLAMVQGEALACGCPVIASVNTGAEDLFQDGSEGFIVPIRSSEAILEKLQQLADDPVLRERMGEAAQQKVRNRGGWDTYGDAFSKLVNDLTSYIV